MSAADGDGFMERPTFAWGRSVVSFAAQSAAAMEDGGSHFPGGLSDCRVFEPDAGRGDSALAIYSQQRCFQWLYGGPSDLAGHAAGDTRATGLAARQMNWNATIHWPIRFSNPNGILSQSPGLRRRRADSPPRSALAKQGAALRRAAKAEGTSYPGCIVRDVSNPNVVVSFGSRRCAATPLGLKHQSNRVPRVVASLQPWALLRSPFGANRGTPRSISTPTPP